MNEEDITLEVKQEEREVATNAPKKLTLKILDGELAEIRKDLADVVTVLNALAENIELEKLDKKLDEILEPDPILQNEAELNSDKQEELRDLDKDLQAPETIDDLVKRIPKTWRNIIDEELGKDFEAEVETGGISSDGAPTFLLKLYIPKNLDRRPMKFGDGSRDFSIKAIRQGSDTDDVKEYCKLVRLNLQKTSPTFKKGNKTV